MEENATDTQNITKIIMKDIHKEVGRFLNVDINFSLLVLRGILFPSEVATVLGLEALYFPLFNYITWKWEFILFS